MLTNEKLASEDHEEAINSNTDVIVLVEETDDTSNPLMVKYLATFFTYRNILELVQQHFASGDFLSGAYFHSSNMVLVEKCSYQHVYRVVTHLIDQGEFEAVFKRIS